MPTIYVPGPLMAGETGRQAIWIFSILEYVVPDWNLILHGNDDADGTLSRWIEGIVTRSSAVTLVSSSTPVDSLLNQASMIWLPQIQEGSPQHLIPIISQRKPVFASSVPTLLHALKHHRAVTFLPPKQPSSWARVIFQAARSSILFPATTWERKAG
ncbi:MAG TPA: hypothetical protein PKA06_07325 [Gemmatales bacterium]|nr:hypothetical protein [Gemmatales bacterium]HMP16771.1 hypothetical protein [Gemmatales bacterium]